MSAEGSWCFVVLVLWFGVAVYSSSSSSSSGGGSSSSSSSSSSSNNNSSGCSLECDREDLRSWGMGMFTKCRMTSHQQDLNCTAEEMSSLLENTTVL